MAVWCFLCRTMRCSVVWLYKHGTEKETECMGLGPYRFCKSKVLYALAKRALSTHFSLSFILYCVELKQCVPCLRV